MSATHEELAPEEYEDWTKVQVSETYDRPAHIKRMVMAARKRADEGDYEYEIDPDFLHDQLAEQLSI